MKKIVTILVLGLLTSFSGFTQKSYEMEVHNLEQINETQFTFDVRMRNTSTPFEGFAIEVIQFSLLFDDYRNGGSLENLYLTYVDNSTDLVGTAMIPSSANFTTNAAQTVMQWITDPLNIGGQTTFFGNSDWKRLGTFSIQLRNADNTGFHNLADMHSNLQISNAIVNECNYTESGGLYYRADASFSLISEKTLTTNIGDRQLAGYWFTGEGDWTEIARWNNVTTLNANTLPGPNANAIINGNATIKGGDDISLLPVDGNGGELTVLTGEEPLFTLTVAEAGAYPGEVTFRVRISPLGDWVLGSATTYVASGSSVQVPAGVEYRVYTRDNTGGDLAFNGWSSPSPGVVLTNPLGSGQEYNIRFVMPANNVIINSTWVEAKKSSTIDAFNQELHTGVNNPPYFKETLDFETDFLKHGSRNELFSSLTLAPLSRLTIDKLFNDHAEGAAAILVQSTPAGTGSLIHNTPGVQATIERYIAAANWGADGDGWHLISSPVTGQAIGNVWTPDGLDDYDFYMWDEVTQFWLNQKDTANGINSFLPAIGYLVAYQEEGTKTFSGTVNVENVIDIPITRTGEPLIGNNVGWNLVGNPYASALSWGGIDWGDVAGTAKIWEETSQGYVDIEPNDPIPSANGVFVYSMVESGTVSMLANGRVHNSTPWYKSDNERILLVAGDTQGETAQQSVVKFNPEATEGFDVPYDAYFMAGYAPLFYSVAEERRFSTNTLPEISSGMNIPFGFHKNSHADFFIEMQESIEDVIIFLTDLKENVTQNLSEDPIYYFSASADDNPDRFIISFSTVSVPEVLKKGLLQAYTYGDMLYVLNPSAKATVELYGVQGQLIMSRDVGQGVNSIPLAVPGGTYIVKMVNADETATRKVIIN